MQAPRGQKAEMKRVVHQAPPREGQKSICDFGEYSVIFQSGNLAQTSRRTICSRRNGPPAPAFDAMHPPHPAWPVGTSPGGCLLGAVSCNQQVSFLPLPMPLLPAILNLGMGSGMLTLFTCCCCLSHVFEKEKMPPAPEIRVRSPGHVKAVLSPNRLPLSFQAAAAVTEACSELALRLGGANGNREPTAVDPGGVVIFVVGMVEICDRVRSVGQWPAGTVASVEGANKRPGGQGVTDLRADRANQDGGNQ